MNKSLKLISQKICDLKQVHDSTKIFNRIFFASFKKNIWGRTCECFQERTHDAWVDATPLSYLSSDGDDVSKQRFFFIFRMCNKLIEISTRRCREARRHFILSVV